MPGEHDIPALDADTLEHLVTTIDQLQNRVDELEERLRQRDAPPRPDGVLSRRALFGLAGAGIAGAAVAATASPAAAADDEPFVLGADNEATDTTTLTHSGDGPAGLRVESTNTENFAAIHGEGAGEVGVLGVSAGTLNAAGVDGVANGELSAGVRGTSDNVGVLGTGTAIDSTGVRGLGQEPFSFGVFGESPFIGTAGVAEVFGLGGASDDGVAAYLSTQTGSHLYLERYLDEGDPVVGPPSAFSERGFISLDSNGDLFLCTEAGEPGVWTRLNDQRGTFLATPQRAYDSRPGQAPDVAPLGLFTAGETRTIDLTTATDLPATATAAMLNVTVAGATGPNGYVTLYDGTNATLPSPSFSTVNWSGGAKDVANTTSVRLTDGTVKVFAGRATHLVIDVIAYDV